MNNLITIKEQDNKQLISARELHEKLGIEQQFSHWFKYQKEKLNLCDDVDFKSILTKSNGGRPSVDYNVTVENAKYICMVSGGKTAQKIREYFIEIEKAWNSPEKVMQRALEFANIKVLEMEKRIELNRPKTEFADQFKQSETSLQIGQFAKMEGMPLGEYKLFKWLRKSKILMSTKPYWNIPYQPFIENGFFEVVPTFYIRQEADDLGEIKEVTVTNEVTYITSKGQLYVYKRLKKEGLL